MLEAAESCHDLFLSSYSIVFSFSLITDFGIRNKNANSSTKSPIFVLREDEARFVWLSLSEPPRMGKHFVE